MSQSLEPPAPSPAPPPPGRRQGWLWRRGRLVLLILGGLGVGHWYQARTSATQTAALLHGSVGQLGACVVGGRPPDPLNPDAARALDGMLFRRLALSLETARPLADCAELALRVRERAAAHRENFYHRSPAEVTELSDIAGRLVSLDLNQSAMALSKQPEPGQAESTTQALLRDLGRALTLSCDIAQAEKAYAVGACPVPGAPSDAPAAPTTAPRIALDISLGEPVASFELTQGASAGEPRVLVSAVGRRGTVRSWIAGLVKSDQAEAAWRTLAVPAPTPPEPAAADRRAADRRAADRGAAAHPEPEPATSAKPQAPAAARLALVASASGWWLLEASRGGSRVFAVDAALTSATQQLQVPSAPGEAAPAPRAAPVPWLGAALLPLGPDLVAVPAAAPTETQLSWLSHDGTQLRTATLKGRLVAALLAPPRVLVADPWVNDAAGETTLSVWRVAERGVTQGAQLKVSHFAFDPQGPSAGCSSQGGAAEDLLLMGSKTRNWLLRLPPAADKLSFHSWPARAPESLHMGCGCEAPFVVRAVEKQLTVLELAKQPGDQPDTQPPAGAPLETPVLFSGRAASGSSAACSAGGRVIAYSVGGAVLTQRIAQDGKASAPVQLAGPSDQGHATAPWLISQGDRLLVFWRRLGGATRGDRLRLEVAETRDAGLTWR